MSTSGLKVLLALALLVATVCFSVVAMNKNKSLKQIQLSMNANISKVFTSKPHSKQQSETEGQFLGLEEALVEVNAAKNEDFRSWSEQVLAELPTKQQVQQDLSFNGEGTPQDLQDAAVGVTELYNYVSKNPSVKPWAVETFKSCANDSDSLDAIRAYCYAKAVRLNIELGGEFWDPTSVPYSIKKLSRSL